MRSKLDNKEAKVIETNGKTFYDTKSVTLASVHNPFRIKFGTDLPRRTKVIPREIAYMGHFGDKFCFEMCLESFTFEEETRLLKYAEIINDNVQAVKTSLHNGTREF